MTYGAITFETLQQHKIITAIHLNKKDVEHPQKIHIKIISDHITCENLSSNSHTRPINNSRRINRDQRAFKMSDKNLNLSPQKITGSGIDCIPILN